MNLPKVVFRAMTLQENIELIKWSYFNKVSDNLDVHQYTLYYFPELADIDDSYSKQDIIKTIEKLVKKNYEKYLKEINSEVKRYNDTWSPLNNSFMKKISGLLNISWPKSIKIIEAGVGLIPVCPRNIDNFSFFVSTKINTQRIIETVAHETLHFLWFNKWRELYPNFLREELDPPYPAWSYSEMVIDPLLNHESIRKILNLNIKSYESFYELQLDGKNVMQNLKSIYDEPISIEEKIVKGYEFICTPIKNRKKLQ